MKGIAIFLFASALGAAGCLTPPPGVQPEAPKQPVAEAKPTPPAVVQPESPPVLPDEVTQANAGQKVEELRRELARAAAEPLSTATTNIAAKIDTTTRP